jgi:3-phenylpropionate/trans-cinnamate dioxygenase ferredoxin reductase subunit
MPDRDPYVVVGAGLAGAKAVQTLREEGSDRPIVLFGAEPERPYERPPLSKGLLLGEDQRESVFVHEPGWYAEHGVELCAGTPIRAVDPAARTVELAGGRRLAYDKLLLATGAVPRRLDVPGAGLDGVLTLRTLADSERLAAALVDGARVVVVGAGWIGLEVTAAARRHGAEVTVLEAGTVPLQRVLGDEIGRVFADLHRDHGVTFRFGAGVRGFAGRGRVKSVLLADGTELPADTVVVGVGVRPDTELADRAGLPVGDGILVDGSLRTADPHVYAAGDVASVAHPLLGDRIRVEHWANALHSGPAAARAMLGQPVSYDRLPYFYTDQYDLGMEYTGHVPPGAADRLVVRGELAEREFVAFWTAGERVLAAMTVNVWDLMDPLQQLIRSRRPVDPARLADPGVPVSEL